MDIIENLMMTGLTRHESTLYIALCEEGELTGYEASKITGISRSNAYLALAGLVEKGGAYRIEGEAGKFIAVPVHEYIANCRRKLESIYEDIIKSAPEKRDNLSPYITIQGSEHIINKMKNIILQAKERIYLSMSPSELKFIEKEIKEAKERGLKTVVITSRNYQLEGVVIYYNEKQPGQIRLIADTTHVLTGEIVSLGDSTCLYSKNRNLVELIKDSLTNEIKLIKIVEEKK